MSEKNPSIIISDPRLSVCDDENPWLPFISPTSYAVRKGDRPLVALFLKKLDQTDFEHNTKNLVPTASDALPEAIDSGHDDIVETLLQKKADPNAAVLRFGNKKPLQMAQEKKNTKAVQLLLAHGAQLNYCPALSCWQLNTCQQHAPDKK